VQQLGAGGVQKELVLLEKINPQDGESHGGAEEPPRKRLAAEDELKLLLAPGGDGGAIRPQEATAVAGGLGGMREEANRGTGVY
jgi:hypothetical protein